MNRKLVAQLLVVIILLLSMSAYMGGGKNQTCGFRMGEWVCK
jgi:hypothetical protein